MLNRIDRNIFLSEQTKRDRRDAKLIKWFGLFFVIYFGSHIVIFIYKYW